ncbi:NAD-dependent protein deacylase [Candidatus Soleaferrea massiliensis]|uniref:NAD-dependent protein deacylase n=1 Tax=Candidatus Soleaferrea massiliensis TaxID=1470354 RepID=UPI00058B318A|nr:NAD-dependent protein deacylase [Candidatus Soleaferrea massiliensis]
MNQALQAVLENSGNIVFFGGAGVSTESGIPDFRSADGLYHQKYRYEPETIISHHFFMQNPGAFYDFYRDRMICPSARPNAAHRALARLEAGGRLKAVITQNIDGLHQMAGSRNVLELHGSIHRNHCMDCHRAYSLQDILKEQGVPRCSCGGVIKPDVVLYEEPLDADVLERAVFYIEQADVLIVGGTSLVVYPAAGLLRYYRGNKLVLINQSPTPADHQASLLIREPIGKAFEGMDEPE